MGKSKRVHDRGLIPFVFEHLIMLIDVIKMEPNYDKRPLFLMIITLADMPILPHGDFWF